MNDEQQYWKIGLLFVTGLVILMILTFATQQFSPFSTQSNMTVLFPDIHGIQNGDAVRVLGVKRGKVTNISLLTPEEQQELTDRSNYNVKLVLSLEGDRENLLNPDRKYRILIRSSSMIGGNYISIEQVSNQDIPGAQTLHFDRPNYGLDTKTGVEGISDWFSENQTRFSEVVRSLKTSSQNIEEVTEKIKNGKGTLGRLLSDEKLGKKVASTLNEFEKTSRKLTEITSAIQDQKGSVYKLIHNDSLYNELNEFSKSARSIADRIKEGKGTAGKLVSDEQLAKDVENLARSSREITEKINKGKGTLGKLVNEDKVYNDLEQITSSTRQITSRIEEGKGALGTVVQDDEMGDNLQQIISDMKEAANSIKTVSKKVDQGSGTVGRLVNEDELYTKAEKSLEGINKLTGAAGQLKTFLGVESNYFTESKYSMHKGYIRVHPNKSRYLQVGASIFRLQHGTSNVTFEESVDNQDDQLLIKPDVMLGYKFFDNRMTGRIGMLEGKVGAGLDYETTFPYLDNPLKLRLEARSSYDDVDDDDLNEHIDGPLVRFQTQTKFAKYFTANAGVSRMTDDPELYVGLNFEYEDQEIRDFFSLLGLVN